MSIYGSFDTLLFFMHPPIKKLSNFATTIIPNTKNNIKKSCPVLDRKSASGTIMPN
jgi:hypothetical protein